MTMGEFSEHRLKYAALIIPGQSPPSDGVRDLNTGLPFLQGNAEFGDVNPTPKYECDTPSKIAHEGDILMSVRAPVGAINVADQSYGIGRGLCAIRTHPDSMRFVYWAIVSRKWHLDSVATGSTYDAVSATDVGELLVPSLPRMRQRAIASFLDRETAKLDTLIAKKERLIELLAEQRMALITQAVTKGLDPNVPMKDSGVEWLGVVPEHWEVRSLKHYLSASLAYGVLKPDKYIGDGAVPLIRTLDIDGRTIKRDQLEQISPTQHFEYSRTCVRRGDLLISVVGTIGKVAFVPDNLAGANLSRALARVQIDDLQMAEFIAWTLDSELLKIFVDLTCEGTAQKVLNLGDLASFRVAAPLSSTEVSAILEVLQRETARIDTLTEKVREAIDRLREYRTALISAAVTGKIDVRDAA